MTRPKAALRERTVRFRAALFAVVFGILAAAGTTLGEARASEPPPKSNTKSAPQKPAPIRLGGKPVYEVRMPRPPLAVRDRAQAAEKVLRDAIESEEDGPPEVRIEHAPDSEVIYLGNRPWLRLSEADADAAGDPSLKVHADTLATRLRAALKAEEQRRNTATRVFSISLAVFATLAALFLLRKTSELSEWIRDYLGDKRKKVPGLSVQNFEVVGPAAMRGVVEVGIEATKWLARGVVLYLWFFVTFSQFSATRNYVAQLTVSFFTPLGSLLSRLTTTLPLALVGVVGVLALALVLRFVALFFDGVAEGETSLAWLERDLARPTGVLLRLFILLAAFLFLAPLLTGDVDGAFPRSALIFLLVLGIGAVPILSSFLLGIALVYRRALVQGQELSYGGKHGRLVEVELLGIVLEDKNERGTRTFVPHLLSLFHPTVHRGNEKRSILSVPVASFDPSVAATLREGLISSQPNHSLVLAEVTASGVRYEITIEGGDAERLSAYSTVHAALAERGISFGHAGSNRS